MFSLGVRPIFIKIFFQKITPIKFCRHPVLYYCFCQLSSRFQTLTDLSMAFKFNIVKPDIQLWIKQVAIILKKNEFKVGVTLPQRLPQAMDSLMQVMASSIRVSFGPENIHQ